MSSSAKALQAYGSATRLRSQRDQDADVFRRISAALRGAADEMGRSRALADARRLWQTVLAANLDPLNPLPPALRAQIVAVANTVLRIAAQDQPEFETMAQIGDNFANGLSGRA